MECEGGDAQVARARLRRFHFFPVCSSTDKIGTYLGEWIYPGNKYGGSIPDESLSVMLTNILPDDVAKEVRDRMKTLTTTQRIIDDINGELSRCNNGLRARLHTTTDDQNPQKGPEHPIHTCIEDKIDSVESKLEECIAAVTSSTPPPPGSPLSRPTNGDTGNGNGDKGDRGCRGDRSPKGLAQPEPNWVGDAGIVASPMHVAMQFLQGHR